jgi:DNA-binding PadR family transcriptional regulator
MMRRRIGHGMKHAFFGWGPGKGWGPRRGRVFDRGDLKYVILDLIEDEPSHGYEIMRSLERRMRGMYSPSAGSVYPTLQMLEDMGYVTSVQREGKKVYEITAEGKAFLQENRGSVESIWGRVGGGWNPEVAGEMHEIKHEMRDVGRLFGRRMREGTLDAETMRRVREVISRAAAEIEEILDDRDSTRA